MRTRFRSSSAAVRPTRKTAGHANEHLTQSEDATRVTRGAKSVQRDCLDKVLVVGDAHLMRIARCVDGEMGGEFVEVGGWKRRSREERRFLD
jgi:hypothetical protein